jgi:hypothetical protein
MGPIIVALAAAATAAANTPLERPTREDTIYVLHGDLQDLEAFEEALGAWDGGELFDKDSEGGSFYFWAYSERTASQARHFIMPAAVSGLEIEIFEYDQEYAFPEIRARADEIAIGCGAAVDPFFVKPTGETQVLAENELAADLRTCLETELRRGSSAREPSPPPANPDAGETF